MMNYHVETSLVATETYFRTTPDGDDYFGSRDLHALISVMCGCHDFSESRS